MTEFAICAHRKDINAELLELRIHDGNCRQLGRSNKGEITRVETEDKPFTPIIRELDFFESLTADICCALEIWCFLSHTCFRHFQILLP
jgi:hypothetical protein